MSFSSFDAADLGSSLLGLSSSWLDQSLKRGKSLFEFSSQLNLALADELWKFFWRQMKGCGRADGPNSEILEYSSFVAACARRWYGLYRDYILSYLAQADHLGDRERRLLSFLATQHINALSPANFFWTNPGAVQRYLDTNGGSLGIGVRNLLDDLKRNDLTIQACDPKAFRLGENLATTPGAVVYRNELMELIQYPAEAPLAYSKPIVIIHPWINKFYIFDLDEQKSLIRFLSRQGFTTFVTSWKNPTREMRGVTYEDYILKGALRAIEVAAEICDSSVHAAGYCLGGTTLAASMALLSRIRMNVNLVSDWSLFTTVVDFSDTGSLEIFITEESVKLAEVLMRRRGYLHGKYIAAVLNLLRSDSQIWWRFSHNYVQGRPLSYSDLMFWNHDYTRLPEAMCSFALRELCLNNKLIQKDALVFGGQPVDLGRIKQPLYAVGGIGDHICQWRSTFAVCGAIASPVRYVLSSGGHITGVINPPSDIANTKFWASDATGRTDPEEWLRATRASRGSWWVDWVRWLAEKDRKSASRPVGKSKYPVLMRAPGQFVLEN